MWIILIIFLLILIPVIVGIILYARKDNYSENENYNYQEINEEKYHKSAQERFGEKGEEIVSRMLTSIQNTHKYCLFNNFSYMYDDVHSTEIDHIFICKGGIFIIETKSNKGIIYGNDNDNMWYQEKEAWQDDKEFMNPVKQNQTHIRLLKRILGEYPPKMYSLVIFPFAKSLENVDSIYVHNLDSAKEFIMDKINNGTYSDKFIDKMNEQFTNIYIKKGISSKQHKENITKDRLN